MVDGLRSCSNAPAGLAYTVLASRVQIACGPTWRGSMAKTERKPLSVRVSEDAWEILEKLQALYGSRLGDNEPVSQSKAVEILLRETAKREKIK